MSSAYPAAFDALPDSVKSMIATTIVTPIEPLLSLGWSDEDIAVLIAHFPDGVGKPYVGSDQATVLGDLAQRRAEWRQTGRSAFSRNGCDQPAGNGHDTAEADATPRRIPQAPLALTNRHRHQCVPVRDLPAGFVADHPDRDRDRDADPKAGTAKPGRGRKALSAFELEKAAAYAVRMNKQAATSTSAWAAKGRDRSSRAGDQGERRHRLARLGPISTGRVTTSASRGPAAEGHRALGNHRHRHDPAHEISGIHRARR
jgi:hypothetical protein